MRPDQRPGFNRFRQQKRFFDFRTILFRHENKNRTNAGLVKRLGLGFLSHSEVTMMTYTVFNIEDDDPRDLSGLTLEDAVDRRLGL